MLRNAAYNLVGVVLPALVALVTTPLLLAEVGFTLFGIAAIQTALLVVIGINDFGVSRAVVLVGVARGGFDAFDTRATVVRAGLELVGCLSLAVVAVSLVSMPFALLAEASGSEHLLLSWSITCLAAGLALLPLPLRSRLEIEERFGTLNLLRSLGSSLMFLGPLMAASVTPTLLAISLGHLASRLLMLLLFAVFAGQGLFHDLAGAVGRVAMAGRRIVTDGNFSVHAELLRRGAWLGAAGLASMLIGYADRIALGMVQPAEAVASYAVSAELVTKLWLITGALTAAATPRIAAGITQGGDTWRRQFQILAIAVAVLAFLSHISFCFAGESILRFWLGAEYRPEIAEIVSLLSIGITINCLSQANFLLLLVKGGERNAALLQFAILPLTFLASLAGGAAFGATGVAVVFSARLLVDTFVVRHLLTRQAGHVGLASFQLAAAMLAVLAVYVAGR